jgi:quaternary ammonium compound-resistance protein SugE
VILNRRIHTPSPNTIVAKECIKRGQLLINAQIGRLQLKADTLWGIEKEEAMNWAILVVAGLFEVGWAIGLKYTEGFTRLWPSVWTVLAMVISLGLLGIAMKTLPVGTAYGVWVGVGAVGTVVLGILLLGESASLPRMVSVALIVAGIVGLKLSTP